MKLKIDISRNVNQQFRHYLGGDEIENGFVVNPKYGTNEAKCIFLEFPGKLEVYHFGATRFKEPIQMQSINSTDSEWLLIHINLSNVSQKKNIGSDTIHFQRNLPIGILFCGPGLEMNTTIPAGVETEVMSIRFSIDFISQYFFNINDLVDLTRNIAYEDIDDFLSEKLLLILSSMNNKLACHGYLLAFLNSYFEKISKHKKPKYIDKLHAKDLEVIIKVSAKLRDPLEKNIPSLESLAQYAGMGMTKFKESFKLVFGKPPMQYRNRIKLEYAREALIMKLKNPSELSYELGYSHPSNFTSAYKNYFGILPSSM